MNIIADNTPEWYAIRCGKVTASRLADALAKIKSGWGASRANYMAELLVERLTGEPAPSFTSPAMQWGVDHEPDARAAYEFRNDCEVVAAGFIIHPSISESGASPDGMIGTDGLVEFKCPNTATHIDTLLTRNIAGKYVTQMQWQMACTGRKWCDFVSFDPRMPETMRLYVHRVKRDDEAIEQLEKDVRDFLKELSSKVAELKGLYGPTVLAA